MIDFTQEELKAIAVCIVVASNEGLCNEHAERAAEKLVAAGFLCDY